MAPIVHIAAFKVKGDNNNVRQLIEDFNQTIKRCVKPSGEKYIVNYRGGKQISTEGYDYGAQVVFSLEFETQEDLNYFVAEDRAHIEFKASEDRLGVVGGAVFDFAVGQY